MPPEGEALFALKEQSLVLGEARVETWPGCKGGHASLHQSDSIWHIPEMWRVQQHWNLTPLLYDELNSRKETGIIRTKKEQKEKATWYHKRVGFIPKEERKRSLPSLHNVFHRCELRLRSTSPQKRLTEETKIPYEQWDLWQVSR